MADQKLTELTKVSSLGANSLLYAVDPNRTAGDQSVSIDPEDLSPGGDGLPNGGDQNDELIKQSGTDGDADWYKKSYLNVKVYGAKGNAIQLQDGAITSGSPNFSSASATFTSDDVGKVMHIEGAGASGGYLTTTIATFTDANNVVLTDNASTTVSGAVSLYGTDDTSAIQDTINAADAQLGGTVFMPNGVYILNGALQNNVGVDLVDYNSQLYIPKRQRGVNEPFANITILGETAPMLGQSSGISTTLPQLAGVVLVSTIQGSGTKPSVICSRGEDSDPRNAPGFWNYTTLKVKNINILTTVNSDSKATVGGVNCFQAKGAYLEYVVVYLYNTALFNTQEPDFIEVDAISMPAINCMPGSYINQVAVGGFTNGFRLGEHTTIVYADARCCVNAMVLTNAVQALQVNHFAPQWNKYNLSVDIDLSLPLSCPIHFDVFKTEIYESGKWYDYVAFVNDPNDYIFGELNYSIVRASIGINNDYFIKNGGRNITCRAFSQEKTRLITSGETLTLSKFNALRTSYNSPNDAGITLPPLSTNPSNPFTPEREQSTIYNIRSTGNLVFSPGTGVTIETIPDNYRTTAGIKSTVKVTYIGSNQYRLEGNLQETTGILTPNVIRYLKFNNNSLDATGNSSPIGNNIVYNLSGKVNESGDFANSSAYIEIPDASDLSFGNGTTDSAFSVTGWYFFDSLNTGSNQLFFNKRGDATQREYQAGYFNSTQTMYFDLFSALGTTDRLRITGSTTPTLSTWTHIAFTYDGSSTEAGMKIYINGVEETYTSGSTGTYVAMNNGTSNLTLGIAAWDLSSLPFTGEMDEFVVWDKELSSSEIGDLVTDGNAGIEIP